MIFNLTDSIVVLFVIYFVYSGWCRGFWRTCIGPLSLVLCAGVAVLYFRQKGNFLVAVGIGIFGPLLLKWFIALVMALLHKANGQKNCPPVRSSLLGAVINLIWNGGILILAMLLLLMVPSYFGGIDKVKANIVESCTMRVFSANVKTPLLETILSQKPRESREGTAGSQEAAGLPAPEDLAQLQNSQEFRDIMDDPRVQKILEDEKTKEQLQQKNLTALMTNPSVLKLLEDPELIRKFFKAYQRMQEHENQNGAQVQGNVEIQADSI